MNRLTPAVGTDSSIDMRTPESEVWFAITTKPLYEKLVGHALTVRSLESFVPSYSMHRRWSDRMKKVDVPLFTGYVFGRFRWDQRFLLRSIPGCRGVVSFGGKPAPVDPDELGNLRKIVDSDGRVEPHPFLRAGQRVRIVGGPLRGVEGFLSERNDSCHLVVTITILQRSVAVKLDRDMIRILLP